MYPHLVSSVFVHVPKVVCHIVDTLGMRALQKILSQKLGQVWQVLPIEMDVSACRASVAEGSLAV